MSVTFNSPRSFHDAMVILLYASVRKVAKVLTMDAFGFHLNLPQKGARHL